MPRAARGGGGGGGGGAEWFHYVESWSNGPMCEPAS